MALDTFNPYLFVSSGEQSNKFLTPTYADGIAQFQAQRAQELTGLTVRIDPIQEGTGDPSPDNIRPISGRTGLTVTRAGKNLGELVEGTKVSSQNCTVTYKEGGVSVFSTGSYGRSGYVIPVVKGKHYTVSFKCKRVGNPYSIQVNNVADWGYAYRVYTSSDMPANDFSKKSFSFVANTDVLFVGVYPQAADTGIYIEEFQIETGDTATAYEPYRGASYPVTWQTEAGTVYGGTLDVVSGMLTVDHILLSVPFWSKTETSLGRKRFSSSYYKQTIKPAVTSSIVPDVICSCFITTSANNGYTGAVEDSITVDTSGIILCYPNRNGTIVELSAADFKTYMDSQQIIAALATPKTYQLSPEDVKTLSGYNQIYSDAGPVIDIKF